MPSKSSQHFFVHHLPPFALGEIAQTVVQMRLQGRDVFELSQVNPNLDPPGQAVEKLVQGCLQPHNHRYSSSQGIAKLREAVGEWYQKRFQVELQPQTEIVATMGIKEGLSHLLFAVASSGDTVLIPTPSYPIHTAATVLAGASYIGVPLPVLSDSTGGERPDVLTEKSEGFFESLSTAYERTWPRPILMIVSFPHNPTATVATLGFFERLVQMAKSKGFYLVHDFAYADLSFDGHGTPSILQVPGAKDVAVECFSLSKGMSLGGWRMGFCSGNERLVAALKKIKSYLDCGVFQPLQIASIKALSLYDSVLSENREIYQSRRDVLAEGLQELGWEFQMPKGSLYLWAKIPPQYRSMKSLAFSRYMLERANVATLPGTGFEPSADEWMRFALVESESRLRAALRSLKTLG